MNDAEIEQFYARMKAEGLKIDPATAEVCWSSEYELDPYRIHPDLPEEFRCVGRTWFARNPDSEIWVDCGDIPEATREALERREESCGHCEVRERSRHPVPPRFKGEDEPAMWDRRLEKACVQGTDILYKTWTGCPAEVQQLLKGRLDALYTPIAARFDELTMRRLLHCSPKPVASETKPTAP
jgi:hypothetical protein